MISRVSETFRKWWIFALKLVNLFWRYRAKINRCIEVGGEKENKLRLKVQ